MFIPSVFRKSYYPLNKITISKSRLLHNYSYLSGISKNLKIAPVLKSNAYGHGINNVAKILDRVGAPFFCVDSLYEAYELLKLKIKTPILIMGFVHPENLKVKKLPFSFAVYDKKTAREINKYQPNSNIHIFVDTGMHREGIPIDEFSDFVKYIKNLGKLKIDGLMSHLGESEDPKNKNTLLQLKNFKFARKILKAEGIDPRWIHIGNSSAILNYNDYQDVIGNVSRSGIAIYGIDPAGVDKQIEPVLELKTYLNQVKPMQKNNSLGYSFTFKAAQNMVIGILPLGYHDGVDRRLSNKGVVKIEGRTCSIIGRVSMNLTTIDITNIQKPETGMEVVVYSRNKEDVNSIYNLAKKINTIPYDLLVNLTTSTRREVVI